MDIYLTFNLRVEINRLIIENLLEDASKKINITRLISIFNTTIFDISFNETSR